MENNQNQIIKQALEIVLENNRFALKSITNNSLKKTNFYKLSDIDLPGDIKDDIKDMDKDPEFIPIKSFEELEREKDPKSDPKPDHEDGDEPKNYKRPKYTGLFATLEKWSLKTQAQAIFQLDFEYAAKEFKLDVDKMKEMSQDEKDQFMRSLGLKTLKEIMKMTPEERAKHMDVEFNDRPRLPNSRILNLNLGNNR
jgi:hypothetical protein